MGLILVENKDLDKYKEGQNIGRGLEAECFLKDSVVTKIFHHPKKQILFSGLNSELISFPKDILVSSDNSLIYAYTMSFFFGDKIKDGVPGQLLIKDLKQAYLNLREEIQKFNDIYMYDLTLDNILFDLENNVLSLIDTSQWEIKSNSFSKNINRLDRALVNSLCRGNLFWLNFYRGKSPELFNLYRWHKLGYDLSFLEFLNCVEAEVQTKFLEKTDTIDDLIPKVYKKS